MISKDMWLKASFLVVVLFLLLPMTGFSQTQIAVSDFTVLGWFRAVKLTWNASAPEGAVGIFEIYRSDKENGPYTLIQEVQLGDKQFIDVITKTYSFLDKKLETGHSYYYKLALRGADQTFGPFRGLATGAIGT
jgi:fibronectin type 3 domain-containing protein